MYTKLAVVRDPERQINFDFIVSEQRKGGKTEYQCKRLQACKDSQGSDIIQIQVFHSSLCCFSLQQLTRFMPINWNQIMILYVSVNTVRHSITQVC